MKKILSVIVAVMFLATAGVKAQTGSKFKGVVFSDYAYTVGNHDAEAKGLNEFTIRRVYLTFETNLTQNFKMRFRLESAHNKFGTDQKINPFVKQAYLEWTGLIRAHALYFGISETNAFKNSESYWGYRSIEKTIMDLNNISSSADMGVAVKGNLGNYLHHWLTVFNGTGYGSSEVDKYKKIGYDFWVTPAEGLIFEAYVDYEKQDADNGTFKYAHDYFQGSSYSTVKGFVGYKAKTFSVGAEAFVRSNKESGSSDALGTKRVDVKKQGFSIFSSLATPIAGSKLFLRYDSFDPNADDAVYVSDTKNGVNDEYTLFIGGLDFTAAKNVHIMPNILIKNYSSDMDSDVTTRLTVYYNYDTGNFGK